MRQAADFAGVFRGDGGFKFQLRDAVSGQLVAVSDAQWRCKAIQRGPLNPTCVKDAVPIETCQHVEEPEPTGWRAADFAERPCSTGSFICPWCCRPWWWGCSST